MYPIKWQPTIKVLYSSTTEMELHKCMYLLVMGILFYTAVNYIYSFTINRYT